MDPVLVFLIVLGLAVLLPLIYVVAIYNRMVSVRNHMRESWRDIDVEMQRRYDLIPNLVEVAKGYAKHERETFEAITEARGKAASNHGAADSQARDEGELMGVLKRLYAVAEAYPELKADAQFAKLSEELANTEDRIAAARRFYNGNVRELNTLVESFPSVIVARMFGFQSSTFFELPDDAARVVPRVDVSRS